MSEVHRVVPAADAGFAEARAGCWALRGIVSLTEWAANCLVRSGLRQMQALGLEEGTRFMNDACGGGSRALEAARHATVTPDDGHKFFLARK